MPLRPTLAPETRQILRLARDDRRAALEVVAALTPDEQLALVCDAPLAHRSALLDLLPVPEAVIPRMPEAELCFTLKAIGLDDSPWILEHATPEQVVACVDLDAWRGPLPDPADLDRWIDALAETPRESFLRALRALDPELVVLYLRHRIAVMLKPNDDDDWQPPSGGQTLDGQFYFGALREGDDVAAIVSLLRGLFESDYWTYFRLMQGVIWELDSQNEEWALRWRSGRLEDLGFPPWEEAMRLYAYLRPEERGELPPEEPTREAGEWHLPVWIPRLPGGADARHLLFRAIEHLDDEPRRACFYAFVSVANRVAVADRMDLADAESTPRAIEKAARFASDGLELLASRHGLEPAEVLRRVSIERLFRVGANLHPEAARPKPPPSPGSDESGPAGKPAGPLD